MAHRMSILMLNFLFPPLAVMLTTGLTSPETILNACLYILAVVPSYIHGFYVSWRYFNKQDKLEQYEWEAISGESRRRKRSHGGTSSRSSSRRSRRSRDHIVYGEVEDYQSDIGREAMARHQKRRSPDRIQQADQMRWIGQIPPPCPEPPTHAAYTQRYLQ